jgi:DnaK suppressor protein
MLTDKKKKYFERLLQQKLNELSLESDTPIDGLPDRKGEPVDFTDHATMEANMDFSLHIKERESRLLEKIKEALERLAEGTFGICEECGNEISEKRLKARPVTTLCIDCKKREEAEEKARGL